RVVDNGTSDRHLLAHPGAHFGAEYVAKIVHLQRRENVFHSRFQLDFPQPIKPAEVLDQLPSRHAIVDGSVRGKEADALSHLTRPLDNVVSGNGGGTPGWSKHRAKQAHGGRLPRSIGPEETEDLAGMGVETDVVNR